MANTYKRWKGAVEPAETAPSGNEYKAWKGAVEPVGAAAATGTILHMAGRGGLAGHGGIAGPHGGLAG